MRFVFALLLIASQAAFSFPEMIRHGYSNCVTCHVSPVGGGILTPYGRSLAPETLTTWGTEKEAGFLHGAVTLPQWLNLGGDIRGLQWYRNTKTYEQAKFVFMQADVEAAVTTGKVRVVGTVGAQSDDTFNRSGGPVISRRHYVSYQHDDHWYFRAGKFFPAYGIGLADHFVSVKRSLGWDEGTESYNLEGGYSSDGYEIQLTGVLGRPDDESLNREKGVILRSAVNLNEHYKVGLGFFQAENALARRFMAGPFAVLGFTPHLFLLAELDLHRYKPISSLVTEWGFVDYLKLDYEVMQGLHLFASQEWSRLNWNDPTRCVDTYSLGVQFFPRPHFEIYGAVSKTRNLAFSSDYSDFFWLLLHYYL